MKHQISHLRILFISLVCLGLSGFSTVPAGAGDNPFVDLISGSKIYFSHIAVGGGDHWETEIAVINPTNTKASATLTPYDSKGKVSGRAVTISLAAFGRYEAKVSSAFANATSIAYIVLDSTTFGLKGYSKFFTGTVRASIVAASPKTDGIFTKIDHQGWTGIAFINTGSATAHITLTAYSNGGQVIARSTKQLAPGVKEVNIAERLFTQPLTAATYIGFHSDQGVVGFFLNGSTDGSMLDGSKIL